MKDVLLGIGLGVVIGYALRRMQDHGDFKCLHDDIDRFADKTKKTIRHVVDAGVNQAEYIKDRVEHVAGAAKSGATN
ncbi:hypothetical protein [Parabacteroides bouchesdurhonensis]|uniref:hypothetical protein n=1 Tax=Parabacteroides bouchesdurhonensis TaxID=1936995 RepID=UPI000C85D2DF|nr:hypothetical protein [Parabacteroides bouchesdurhonensis]